jgi:hypothetical protein
MSGSSHEDRAKTPIEQQTANIRAVGAGLDARLRSHQRMRKESAYEEEEGCIQLRSAVTTAETRRSEAEQTLINVGLGDEQRNGGEELGVAELQLRDAIDVLNTGIRDVCRVLGDDLDTPP